MVEITTFLDIQKLQTIEQQKSKEKFSKNCDELIESEKILKKKFDKVKSKGLELAGRVGELERERGELAEERGELKGEVNEVKGKLLESRNDRDIWELKFESEKKSYDKLESDFFGFTKENQKLRGELEDAKAKISHAENEKIDSNWELKILHSEKSELEKTIIDLKDSLKSLQEDSSAKNTQDVQLATLTATAHDEKISDLEKNLAATQKSLSERSTLTKDLKKSLSTLQTSHSALTLTLSNLQTSHSTQLHQISAFPHLKSHLQTQITSLQSTLEAQTQKNQTLKQKNHSIQLSASSQQTI